jgi:CelD/BcsL family acetyltransferase involved in cellulose biosynthesis
VQGALSRVVRSTHGLQFELVSGDAIPSSLRSGWGKHAAEASVSPFAWPAFFDAWCSAFSDDRIGLVVAGWDRDELAFVLPIWHSRDRPSDWETLGAFRADYTEAIARQRPMEAGAAFWRWLERDAACRTAKLARIPADNLLARTVPSSTLARRGRVYRGAINLMRSRRLRYVSTDTQQEHPYADRTLIVQLAERLDARYMRRNMKMLSKAGGDLSYAVIHGARAIAPLLPRFFELHVANFAGTGRTSQFESDRDRAFYQALVEHPELGETIYMDVLRVADRLVAMHLGFQHQGCIYYYKPAFDLELAKASPGKILLAHIFARATQQGVHRVDLLKGLESYKTEWANRSLTTLTSSLVHRDAHDVLRRVGRTLRAPT